MVKISEKATDYRILSVDGGGIYGLVDVLWLKRLCQSNAGFLNASEVEPEANPVRGLGVRDISVEHVLAGASAGAVTVLLMARDKDLRKALLSGEIEGFWKSPIGAFTNKLDPVDAWFSLWGIGGWTGEKDFQQLLEKHFGDMTLGQLPHKVVITVFDWTGEFKASEVSAAWPPPLVPWNGHSCASRLAGHLLEARVISNFYEEHKQLPVKKVAYWAATPPGLRTVRNGLADAATFGANPALDALSLTFQYIPQQKRPLSFSPSGYHSLGPFERALRELDQLLRKDLDESGGIPADAREKLDELLRLIEKDAAGPQRPRPEQGDGMELGSIAMLSLGNGNRIPSFWLRDFNLGMQMLLSLPSNPYQRQWFPFSTSVALDAPMEQTNSLCYRLLGSWVKKPFLEYIGSHLHLSLEKPLHPPPDSSPEDSVWISRYYRLNPGIMQLPVLVASMLARWDVWRHHFINEIERNVESAESKAALHEVSGYVKSGWFWPPLKREQT